MLWESTVGAASAALLRAPGEVSQQEPAPAAREGHFRIFIFSYFHFHSRRFCMELPGCVRHIQLSGGMRERLAVKIFPFFKNFFFKG